jgi:hypothetical protein
MTDSGKQLIAKALERAGSDPFFVASRMTEYMNAHGVDEASLAELLHCRIGDLPRLAFCRAPAGSQFAQDLRRIAEFVPCDADALVQVLRQAEALEALRHESRATVPMAARDRLQPQGPNEDGDGS